jgi:recombination associated protein RdgC
MFFRNLTLFQFPNPGYVERTEAGGLNLTGRLVLLADALDPCRLKPVGPLELASHGFVPPHAAAGDEDVLLRHSADRTFDLITVGSETRLLPGAVVNAELAKRLAAIEHTEGRKPGGRARKRIKDELVTELLPKALVRPGRMDAYIDHARGLLVVDTSTRKRAEGVAAELRRAIGSFPASPLNAEVAPRTVLTGWLAGDPLPDGFSLGDFAILKDASDKGASVRLTRQTLRSDEVARHLEAGKQCTRLALVYEDSVAFTLDEDLILRGVQMLDGAVESLESIERDDLVAELDARFCLMTGLLGGVFDTLFPALRISEGED